MKFQRLFMHVSLVTFLTWAAPSILAGPSCNVRPNHPNCDPSELTYGPIYKVTFSNIETGMKDEGGTFVEGIYTTPETLNGDESGLNANQNGPNEVRFLFNNVVFLRTELGSDIDACFPAGHRLGGSIQMIDNSNSGGDPYRVGYIWVHAYTTDGNDMQYAIDLFDVTGSWVEPLLPSNISTRTVTHWELRATKKKYKTGCETNRLVEEITDPITITIKPVAMNPWYD